VQEALGVVIFAVVGVALVAAVAALFTRSSGYDHIGRGRFSIDRDPPAAAVDRDAEIRQMLGARNARRVAREHPPLDVDAEVERRLRDGGG
jgi:hypothetical protein